VHVIAARALRQGLVCKHVRSFITHACVTRLTPYTILQRPLMCSTHAANASQRMSTVRLHELLCCTSRSIPEYVQIVHWCTPMRMTLIVHRSSPCSYILHLFISKRKAYKQGTAGLHWRHACSHIGVVMLSMRRTHLTVQYSECLHLLV
jgi:hypothetical protein